MAFKKLTIATLLAASAMSAQAQDDLIKKVSGNGSDSAAAKWKFKTTLNLECTDVKNQGSSGTCWSYATNSFLESEMIRMGKKPLDLAEIFTARCVYIDKADNYIRMHGAVSWGDGGSCHDVINMYAKYGAMPQNAYTGLNYGTSKNRFGEMQAVLKGMLDALVSNPNGKLTPNWKAAFTAVLDAYLGPVDESFTWKGKSYTPKSFAKEQVGINPKDYIELASFQHVPYYTRTLLMVPDNWSFDRVYNVPMNDITTIIDNALSKGYTIAWATDVSEKGFSWKNGVAFVPDMEEEDITKDVMDTLFAAPRPDKKITAAMRQAAFDNYATTDDHGMHIVGTARDQTGKEYYLVKNSWGDKNDYKGYLYVSKPYVLYKTTALLLHRGGIPADISNSLGL